MGDIQIFLITITIRKLLCTLHIILLIWTIIIGSKT